MEQNHIGSVVEVHLRSFPSFFLTFLGERFLQLLYQGIVTCTNGIGYVWTENGHVVGFVAGTTAPAGFYRRLLLTLWWQFGWAALGAAIRRPTIIPRLLRAFLYPSRTSASLDAATLMSIAVDPTAQGQGVGRRLVVAFLDEARRCGARRVNLTTDREDNEAVNRFYQRLGFTCVQSYTTPEGRAMNEYEILLE